MAKTIGLPLSLSLSLSLILSVCGRQVAKSVELSRHIANSSIADVSIGLLPRDRQLGRQADSRTDSRTDSRAQLTHRSCTARKIVVEMYIKSEIVTSLIVKETTNTTNI